MCVCACALERDSWRSILAPWGSVDQELEQGQSWALMSGQASQMTREELPHAHSSGLPPCQGASVPTQRLPCGQWMRVSSAGSSLPGRSLGVAGSTWFWVPFSPGVRFISVSSCLGSVCGTPSSSCRHPQLFLSGVQATRGGCSPFPQPWLCSLCPRQVPRGRASCTGIGAEAWGACSSFLRKTQRSLPRRGLWGSSDGQRSASGTRRPGFNSWFRHLPAGSILTSTSSSWPPVSSS